MTLQSTGRSELGERIARLRKLAGLTQDALAGRVGIARPYLAQVERRAIPRAGTAVRLARQAGGGPIDEVEAALLALDHHEPEAASVLRQYVASRQVADSIPARSPEDRPRAGAQPDYDLAYRILLHDADDLGRGLRGLSPSRQWWVVATAVAGLGERTGGETMEARRLEVRNGLLSAALHSGIVVGPQG